MKQPTLFRVPKARYRIALEKEIHCMVADDLRRWCKPPWLWTHFPAGEARTELTGALLKRMGTQPGWSDFLIIGPPAGRLHALELKRAGRKPTPTQNAFLEAVRGAGGLSGWVDNYPDAVSILVAWGVIPNKIRVQL